MDIIAAAKSHDGQAASEAMEYCVKASNSHSIPKTTWTRAAQYAASVQPLCLSSSSLPGSLRFD
jgi:hypothetical protein